MFLLVLLYQWHFSSTVVRIQQALCNYFLGLCCAQDAHLFVALNGDAIIVCEAFKLKPNAK